MTTASAPAAGPGPAPRPRDGDPMSLAPRAATSPTPGSRPRPTASASGGPVRPPRRPWRRAWSSCWPWRVAVARRWLWVVGWSAWLGVDDVGVSRRPPPGGCRRPPVQRAGGHPLARVDTDAVGARVRERVTSRRYRCAAPGPAPSRSRWCQRSAALVVRNPQGQVKVVDAEGVIYATVGTAPQGGARRHRDRRRGHRAGGPARLARRCSTRCRRTSRGTVSGISVSSGQPGHLHARQASRSSGAAAPNSTARSRC